MMAIGALRALGAQNVKICSGRFSAGFGAAVSCRGLMIGGGGSTANRTAADDIGTAVPGCGAATGAAGDDAGATDAVLEAGAGVGATMGAAAGVVCIGRCSIGRTGALCIMGRGTIGRGAELDIIMPAPAPMPIGAGATGASPPRKSLTRVSTS
jgi:hypothetical protein